MLDFAALPNADPMLPRPFRVVRVVRETSDTTTLTFEPADGFATIAFGPAQMGMVGVPGLGEVPISFSSDPADPSQLAMTIRRAGAITSALVDLSPGDSVSMRGPYGTEWPMEAAEGQHLLVVAGGLGLAPLRSAIVTALRRSERYRSISLVYGRREVSEVVFADDLAAWEANPAMSIHLTLDRADPDWSGPIGLVTSRMDAALLDPASTTAMVCGPDVMMHAVGADLTQRGVDSGKIWLTMERNMKCGIGLCGHCQFGPLFICKDGPVVDWATAGPFYLIAEV